MEVAMRGYTRDKSKLFPQKHLAKWIPEEKKHVQLEIKNREG